jgi:FkbM family methyltransferase
MIDIVFQGGADQPSEVIQVDAFREVLKEIKTATPVMIEIGSNDCFYSITFNEAFSNAKNICIEISQDLLELGKKNVEKNGNKGFNFIWGSVGQADLDYLDLEKAAHPELYTAISPTKLSLKDVYDQFGLSKVDLIHMDICGTEIEVLQEILDSGLQVDYLFVSTHAIQAHHSPTHQKCVDILTELGVEFIFSDESRGGCGDGLIVCRVNH